MLILLHVIARIPAETLQTDGLKGISREHSLLKGHIRVIRMIAKNPLNGKSGHGSLCQIDHAKNIEHGTTYLLRV
jgi:hypothetical protein